MELDFRDKNLTVTMVPYLQELIDEFPDEIGVPATTPAAAHLFDESENPVLLDGAKAKLFHHVVAKTLWAGLRARPDLLTTLSYLTCRVKAPDVDDYKKLVRMQSYIKGTVNLPLRLSVNGSQVVKWWVDASYTTRKNMRSQTGGTMSLRRGSVYNASRKQKLNTTSFTEAELVAANDIMPQVIWISRFLQRQGLEVTQNVLYQENKSAMLLETNGSGSSSKRPRHMNVRFFSTKDRVTARELEIQYCLTDLMIGDFLQKPYKVRTSFSSEKQSWGNRTCEPSKEYVGFRNIMVEK
jgi:lambda repressor-like predicted transcriptional regulator